MSIEFQRVRGEMGPQIEHNDRVGSSSQVIDLITDVVQISNCCFQSAQRNAVSPPV